MLNHIPQDTDVIWEQIVGESDKAFAAFCHYRNTSPHERSLQNTVRALNNTSCQNWGTDYSWKIRAGAYDNYIDRKLRAEREQLLVKAMLKHHFIAEELIAELMSAGLNQYEVRMLREKVAAIKDACNLSRVSLGWTVIPHIVAPPKDDSQSAAELAQQLINECQSANDEYAT